MTYPSVTAATIMNASAAMLNDVNKQVYSFTAQIPYLNIALQELQEIYEENEVPVTTTESAVMAVPAGTTSIGFASSGLKLPSDLIEPTMLWERLANTNPYSPMTKVDILPLTQAGILVNQFVIYTWESQEIRVQASDQANDIKMNYIKLLFTPITASTDNISVINVSTFLEFRTASLCAEFIGENKSRGDSLNMDAINALDRALGISSKSRQNIMTRRQPFRSGYKQRSFM